ncbi:MAG TPA: PEP-CTERM sorting domain-containing protein [Fimbriimonadales bacterium]|nr:PEP-CTERM sorting domain-containing protein [Fimbriimonadales bacterium]
MKYLRPIFSLIVLSAFLLAKAQYKAVILPTSDGYGQAFHAGGGQITGIDFNLGNILWNGPNYDQFVRLRTTGYSAAQIWDTDGGRQVGYGNTSGTTHALLWSGPGSPVVDLHLDGYRSTGCFGTDGISQVGYGARFENTPRAKLWRGTPESAVDLNPAGVTNSEAYDCWGDYQVGNIELNIPVMWSGTAASMRRLPMPGGINSGGTAHAIYGDQIVGTGGGYACLWSASTLQLTILGEEAAPVDTNGIFQVGSSGLIGEQRATRWSGKPGSLFDLHRFLPDFRESFATGINEDGTIAGWGWDADNNARAIAWVPVPEPGTLAALGAGLLFLVSRRRAAKNKPKDSAGEQP